MWHARPYSARLCRVVLRYLQTHTIGQTAEHFHLPKSTVWRWGRNA